jgi:hypothetical protein
MIGHLGPHKRVAIGAIMEGHMVLPIVGSWQKS